MIVSYMWDFSSKRDDGQDILNGVSQIIGLSQ